jgi:hypothetical protein
VYARAAVPHPQSDSGHPRAGFFLVLAGFIVACGLILYLPTLPASWAYDDMDHLNAAADVLAGRAGYWRFVFRPHLEHLVPAVRMLFHANEKLFGVDAFPLRLLVLVAHFAGAFLIGLAARRYSTTNAAGIAAALAYIVPGGFSSMWVWLPTGAGVPLGMVGIAGGLAAIANRSRLGVRNARILAAGGGVLALMCENSLAPLLACPALLDEYERRREGRTKPVGPLTAFLVIAVAAWSFLSSTLYAHLTGEHFSFNLRHGIPRAVFLVAVAPFRYLFPGLPLSRPGDPPRDAAVLGSLLGLAVAGIAALVALVSSRGRRFPLLEVAALTAVGPVGVIALVGLRRWTFLYEELYDADRYFFTLLVPAAFIAAFFVDRIAETAEEWSRRRRTVLAVLAGVFLVAELAAHKSAVRKRFPRAIFDAHERRFAQLGLLASRLNDVARSLPPEHPSLHFPDTAIWFPEVHNGRVSTRLLLFVIDRARPASLQLGSSSISAEDERLLNPALSAWAGDVGESLPYLSIRNGALVNARESGMADFRTNAGDEAVVGGFYAWEGSSRWMGRRGDLRLVMTSPRLTLLLAAPMKAIRATHPDWKSLDVRVTLVDEITGFTVPAGAVSVADEGVQPYRLEAPGFLNRVGNARRVHLVIECDQVWRPIDVLPGSHDPRELTVQVFQAGFERTGG